jgi:hypothetical protein
MKKSSLIVSLAGVAALMLPFGLLADSHEGAIERGPISDIWYVVPKRGMEAQFAEAMQAHVAFRAEAGETQGWQAYRVVAGHDISPIAFRKCCFEWADLDAYEAENAEKGLTANFNENVDQYVDHYHHYLERIDWENSNWPENDGPFYRVTTWTVKQGAGPGTEEARKKLSDVALNQGWADADHNWVWLSRIVGKPITQIVSSYENYADMAPTEPSFFEFVTEKLGAEEAAAVFSNFGSGFTSADITIWKYDASLSTPSDDE